MKVSIIIPCHNRLAYTKECCAALEQNTPDHVPWEAIVIDNASTDGTDEFLSGLSGRIRHVRMETNVGFAAACNQGARIAAGDLLLFLNNDTRPLPGWLEPMLDLIEHHPTIGIVGSKLLYPDGRIQHAGVIVKASSPTGDLQFGHIHRFDDATAPWVNRDADLQCVTGACLLIRRGLFEAVKGFDEGFINSYEDLDLCFKVRALGYRVCYCPRSVLIHHESVTEGRNDRNKQNAARLNERWRGKIRPDDRDNYDVAGKLDLFELNQELAQMQASLGRIKEFKRLLSTTSNEQDIPRATRLRMRIARLLGLPDLARDVREIRTFLYHSQRTLKLLTRLLDRYAALRRKEISETEPLQDLEN